jgi:hypothetical protein
VKVSNLIFSAPMVLAMLAGRKRQTRRFVAFPRWAVGEIEPDEQGHPYAVAYRTGCLSRIPCPWGGQGDAIYVREACRAKEVQAGEARRLGQPEGIDGVEYLAGGAFHPIAPTAAAADLWVELNHYGAKRGHSNRKGRVVPAIHQPRWASRLTLELATFHVERLHEISEVDARKEGVETVAEYFDLWRTLHGVASFTANPWVWVLNFSVHQLQVDDLRRQRGIDTSAEEAA